MTTAISFEEFQDVSSCTFEETDAPWAKVQVQVQIQVRVPHQNLYLTFIRDTQSNEIYNCDSPNAIRLKFAQLIPITALFTIARAVYSIGKVIRSGGSSQEINTFKNGLYYTTHAVGAACYGIAYPYEGRRLFTMCERRVNGHEKEADFENGFYLARCFVPINHRVADKTIQDMNILKIKRAVYREHIQIH